MTVKRIITSGPQTIATVWYGSNGTRGISVVTTPTLPAPVARGAVDRDVDLEAEVAPATPSSCLR